MRCRNLLRFVFVQSRGGLFVPVLLQGDTLGFAIGAGFERKLGINNLRKEFVLALGENLRLRLTGKLRIQVLPLSRDRNCDIWVQAVSALISVQDLRIDLGDGLLRGLEIGPLVFVGDCPQDLTRPLAKRRSTAILIEPGVKKGIVREYLLRLRRKCRTPS